MIPGISSGGGSQSLDLSAGPSQSGSAESLQTFGNGPVIYAKNADDWKKYAVVGLVVLGGFWLSRKK